MKVLLTGATGTIGSGILRHLLLNPDITSVVTLTRRPLPPSNPKTTNIVIPDFQNWDAAILTSLSDADAMVWAMGTSDTNEDTNYNFILAFQQAFLPVLPTPRRNRFRYVLTSGLSVEPDQEKSLWFLDGARKLKGRTETWSLNFAKEHEDVWQTWIIKPGGVATAETYAVTRMAIGLLIMPTIRDDEVGAFVADLLVHGKEPEGRILNERMVARGAELLASTYIVLTQKARD
ncbi:hypothetical protein B0H15DRAFT_800486 [Mycena belliarum]|uniref:NAD(P)-binding domain-containing protein n=1 Tax=Mycena belliarum TaxID=1033014 RepID=A0AAD6XSJ0_9AGAR|nr:hypothetical protein B0H15DRAFT_800486 [Mycena belliae]